MMPSLVVRFGDPLVGMRSFYYGTALSAGISTLSALCQLTDPDHILFGTDFPFAPNWAIRSFGETLDSLAVTGFDRESVYVGNAARLLGLDTREIPTMGRGGG